jgi:anti-sigma factor RsiW
MKHFGIWQWVDFVRDLGEQETRSAMAAHLSSPCPRCQRIVNVLRAVTVAAQSEFDYEPPGQAIRYAEALYSLQRPQKATFPRLIARLVHDSLSAPLPAGMRAQNRLSRHALFEAGSYYLDLQLEHQPAAGLIALVGQLANRTQPETSTAEIPIWLKDRNRLVASTVCNRFGEFQLEYAPIGNLRLHIPLPAAGKRLEVSLNDLNPAPLSRPRSAKTTRRQTRPR